MSSDLYKRYTASARRGIQGEAFFETIVSRYCIPHQIVGSKDVGIDYICEWVYEDKPTGVLFGVQVKTFLEESADSIKALGKQDENGLELYEIHYYSLLKVEPETCQYWKGFGIPIYLFAIVQDSTENLTSYYKRYTPFLTSRKQEQDFKYYAGFCKVSDGMKFIAFKYMQERQLGFARDLYIDYMRCCYSKGVLTHLSPGDIGLDQFTREGLDFEDAVFEDLFEEYSEEVHCTYSKIQRHLGRRSQRTDCSRYVLTTGWDPDWDAPLK